MLTLTPKCVCLTRHTAGYTDGCDERKKDALRRRISDFEVEILSLEKYIDGLEKSEERACHKYYSLFHERKHE